MAATADKYSANTWNDKDDTSQSPVKKQILALLPLALTEYGSDSNFKAKFFCHDVWKMKDSAGKDCVIGLLNPSSASYQYYRELHRGCSADSTIATSEAQHSKKGKLHLQKGSDDYIVLNDGGLNTKAFIDFVGNPSMVNQDFIIFTITYQNAYYLNTHTSGNDGFVLTIFYGTNFSQSHDIRLVDVPTAAKSSNASLSLYVNDIPNGPVQGDQIKLRLASKNDEGTYKTAISQPITLGARVCVLTVYKITSLSDNPVTQGAPYTVYLEEWFYTRYSSDNPNYPNLYNIFQNINTEYDSKVRIHGVAGVQLNKDIPTSYLPDGMYYGFPNEFYIPGVTVDPPENSKVLYIRTSPNFGTGQAYKYNNSSYSPTVVPQLTAVSGAFETASGQPHSPYYDSNTGMEVVYPIVGLTGKGIVGANVVVSHRVKTSQDVPWTTIFTQSVDINLGSSVTTGYIPYGEGGTTGELPAVEVPCNPAGTDPVEIKIEVYEDEYYNVSDEKVYEVTPSGGLTLNS